MSIFLVFIPDEGSTNQNTNLQTIALSENINMETEDASNTQADFFVQFRKASSESRIQIKYKADPSELQFIDKNYSDSCFCRENLEQVSI